MSYVEMASILAMMLRASVIFWWWETAKNNPARAPYGVLYFQIISACW